jgi:hypothetical protein
MSDSTPDTLRWQHGHTLIEVMVASTLFVLFVVGLYGATGVFFSLLDIQKSRTESLTSMNVARSRLIADARGVSTVSCAGSDTLSLTTEGGGPPLVVEYKASGKHLNRWISAENKDYRVVDRLVSLECDTLSDDAGVNVAMVFGGLKDRFALHLSVLDAPPAAPEDEP